MRARPIRGKSGTSRTISATDDEPRCSDLPEMAIGNRLWGAARLSFEITKKSILGADARILSRLVLFIVGLVGSNND